MKQFKLFLILLCLSMSSAIFAQNACNNTDDCTQDPPTTECDDWEAPYYADCQLGLGAWYEVYNKDRTCRQFDGCGNFNGDWVETTMAYYGDSGCNE